MAKPATTRKTNNKKATITLVKPTPAESETFGGKPSVKKPDDPSFLDTAKTAFVGNLSNIERLADTSSPTEQARLMRELVGDLDGVELMGNRVLVGIYIEPAKRGSLYLAKDTLKESVYQGVVGLVLKLGKQAFEDDPDNKVFFHGQKAFVGQWVAFRSGDAKRTQLRGVDCRMVEDTLIDMVVSDPNIITHQKL